MTYVLVDTRTWNGTSTVVTMVDAVGDGRDLAMTLGPPDGFHVTPGTAKLVITVRPVPSEWWRADVEFSVGADGSLTLTDRGDAIAVDIQNSIGAFYQASRVTVRLSRVKVVTDQATAATTRVPPPIPHPQGVDARIGAMIDTTNAERELAVKVLLSSTTPVDGKKLRLVPLSPLPTIDPAGPVAGGRLKFRSGPVAPANQTFVVEVAGDSVVPRTIAVSWPDAVPRGQPAPMYVYFRHAPKQETEGGVGKYDTVDGYPYSFDYVFFCLLSCLWYSMRPDLLPYSQGIAYQIEASGKKVVSIVACPTVRPNNKSTQFGEWTSAEFMQDILLQIQALAAAQANKPVPTALGRVALGAFSSSHWHLLALLKNNKGHAFLTNTVKECYLFDPDNFVLPDLIPHLLDWEKGVPAGAAVIRLYNHRAMPEQRPLIDPVPTGTPHLTKARVGNRTVFAATSSDWDRSLAAFHGAPSKRAWTWPDEHFAIAAFMLTHAIANSGF